MSDPSQILKAGTGTLHETPLPELLHALLVSRRTCTLELRQQALEKQIFFEDGAPIACSSNVAQESLGKFLVERNLLKENEFVLLLSEAASKGIRLEELLLQKGVFDEQQLSKHLQANLGRKILDGFRWVDARYRLLGTGQLPDSAQRMNPLQLIYTGVTTVLPFERLQALFPVEGSQRFALVHEPPHPVSELKLGQRDARLLEVLAVRPSVEELTAALDYTHEEALRRLYALCVLGVVDRSERVSLEPPRPARPPEPVPAAAPPAPAPEVAADDVLASFPTPRRSRTGPWLLGAVGLAALAAVAWYFLRPEPPPPPAPPPVVARPEPARPARPKRTPPPPPELPQLPAEGSATGSSARGLSLSESGIRFPLPSPRGAKQPFTGKGIASLAKGKAEEALAWFQKAAKAAPKEADAQYGWALAAFELRRDDEAAAHAQAAMTLGPKHAAAHLLAGHLAHRAGRLDEARALYGRFLELSPQSPDAHAVAAIAAQLGAPPK